MGSLYDVLGVPVSASDEEIRRAYRALARVHHPDTQPADDPAAAASARRTMADLNSAWSVLGDPQARRDYDRRLGSGPGPGPGSDPARGRSGPGRQWAPPKDDEFDDSGGPGNFGFDHPDEAPTGPLRITDLLVMTPVAALAGAIGFFLLSLFSGSQLMSNLSLLMLPVAAIAFLTAPLFAMIRARSRSGAVSSASSPADARRRLRRQSGGRTAPPAPG